MFERFTELARISIVLAQDEARALSQHYIGTEHLLLGLLHQEEGLAYRVLNDRGITEDTVRAMVEGVAVAGGEKLEGQIPFTPRAKKALELSLREALSLGQNYVDTEHILLGLVRQRDGVAARILLDFTTHSEIRDDIIKRLSKGVSLTEMAEPLAGPKLKTSLVYILSVNGKTNYFLEDGTQLVNATESW